MLTSQSNALADAPEAKTTYKQEESNMINLNKTAVFVGLYVEPSFGEWYQAEDFTTVEDIEEKAKEVLSRYNRLNPTCPAEEWLFSDWENFLIPMHEQGIEELLLNNEILAELDEPEIEPFTLWFDNDSSIIYHNKQRGLLRSAEEIVEDFREAFLGVYEDLEEYAQEYVSNLINLEKALGDLHHYFDYEAFAHDLQVGGDVWAEKTEDFQVAVFANL